MQIELKENGNTPTTTGNPEAKNSAPKIELFFGY